MDGSDNLVAALKTWSQLPNVEGRRVETMKAAEHRFTSEILQDHALVASRDVARPAAGGLFGAPPVQTQPLHLTPPHTLSTNLPTLLPAFLSVLVASDWPDGWERAFGGPEQASRGLSENAASS